MEASLHPKVPVPWDDRELPADDLDPEYRRKACPLVVRANPAL